jgi:hypothetical protein
MVRAMSALRFQVPVLLAALTLSCSSEDPRLPQSLYDKALELNKSPEKKQEAKSLMELIANRYPDSPAGNQAKKDLFLLDTLLKLDIQDRQKLVKTTMRETMNALIRYQKQTGEYPDTLARLVPEYLDKVPETAWGHPFFYRPYVKKPIEDVPGRRGVVVQRVNTKCDGYFLVCLGVDLQPGGEDMAADFYIVNGDFVGGKAPFPIIPLPQPVR